MSYGFFSGPTMRRYHRWIAVIGVIFALYIAPTGLAVQTMDLWAVMTGAPASDPTMRAIHVGLYGPPNFQVLGEDDYTAAPLPGGFDYNQALSITVKAARAMLGQKPISFVEMREVSGKPEGLVASGKQKSAFDVASGTAVGAATPIVLPKMEQPALRNDLKTFHRMKAFGSWFVALDAFAGFCLSLLILTGLILYIKLLQGRVKMGRNSPFWSGGGNWRVLHRGIGLVAALFLLVMAVSGTILSISSIGVVIVLQRQHGKRPAISQDESRPLADSELPGMLHTTLAAYHRDHGSAPIKVVRLRYFAGMPQGVIVGVDRETEQFVYDARSGHSASLSEPGYPDPGQTFGWQVDETVKEIHRGDYFGLTGRWISLISGFSLLYLACSGVIMYLELWKRRRKGGRNGLFWS